MIGLTEEQLALRRTGIGGSEIAAVAGLDPYRTALDVYLAKVEGWMEPLTAPMERGIFLEDGIANWYAHRTGRALRAVGTIRHPRHPLMLCTPDRLAGPAPDTDETLELDLSIKAPGPYVREQWGDPGTDDVPQHYLVQEQWELAILRALWPDQVSSTAHLAAPIDGDLRVYVIREDVEIQEMLREAAERFWRDHVERREPPPIDGSPSCAAWLKRKFSRDTGPMLEASAEQDLLAVELQEAERAAAAADERVELAKNRLKAGIGEAAGLQGPFGRVTWKANKNNVRSFRTYWRR